jgi:small-conductance mechanosensitive channel/CRP-like cAMP-binding protein
MLPLVPGGKPLLTYQPMISTLSDTQRAVVTILIFFVTFFLTLSIGRMLKRRAGVRLGVLFQFFCITAAFYAAIWSYGVPLSLLHHIRALLILTSTVVVVALINRYLWDYYFEKKKQTPIPHFLREMVALLVFLIALLLVLSFVYHAEAQLKGLLAGSGIIAIILGFAGQNLFGGIIAGISLQISRPYKVGDWLQVGERFAEVMEINWRSTRLRTNDAIYLDIPNNEIVRQTIVNLHYPSQVHAMRIRVGVDYKHPPNRVKDVLMRATKNAELVLREPPPKIFLVDFADHAVIYEIKFYMGNHAAINEVNDAIRTNVWYELKRQRITIPFPIRTLHLERRAKDTISEEREKARAILRDDPLFQCLDEEQLDSLLERSQVNRFGRGERVIEEGAAGDSMFVLLRGTAQVSVARNGAPIRVGMLRAGDLFGEMSLLTGEPRTATVRAEHDCEVLEISKPVMSELLHRAPQCLDQLSELLAKRKMETEGIVREAMPTEEQTSKEREYRATFLQRLRTFFEL